MSIQFLTPRLLYILNYVKFSLLLAIIIIILNNIVEATSHNKNWHGYKWCFSFVLGMFKPQVLKRTVSNVIRGFGPVYEDHLLGEFSSSSYIHFKDIKGRTYKSYIHYYLVIISSSGREIYIVKISTQILRAIAHVMYWRFLKKFFRFSEFSKCFIFACGFRLNQTFVFFCLVWTEYLDISVVRFFFLISLAEYVDDF